MVGMEIVVPDEFKYLFTAKETRAIVKIPDAVLRQKAQEVSKVTKKTHLLVDELMRQMRTANGVGLAAPQLGILQRVVVIAPLDYRPMALINPKVTKMEGEQVGVEGCLSIPGLYGDVKRAEFVEIQALDRKGRSMVLELEGHPARVAQHEIDHLDGKLFIDTVDIATLHWLHPSPHDPDEI